jgi:hypothetical protein
MRHRGFETTALKVIIVVWSSLLCFMLLIAAIVYLKHRILLRRLSKRVKEPPLPPVSGMTTWSGVGVQAPEVPCRIACAQLSY